MKMNPEPPNVKDNGTYRTSEAIAALGMDRTSFLRLANHPMMAPMNQSYNP